MGGKERETERREVKKEKRRRRAEKERGEMVRVDVDDCSDPFRDVEQE